jgi:hypothetical protein
MMLSMCLCLVALATSVAAAPLPLRQLPTIYVAPHGRDSGHGTAAQPFATLRRARDEIRQQRQASGTEDTAARVEIACGRYSMVAEGRLELTAQDSNITWARGAAEPAGCAVLLTGGALVERSAWRPAAGPRGLWQATLSGSGNISVAIPPNTTRLVVGGKPRQRVRTAVLHWNRTIEPSHGGVNTKCDLSGGPTANISQNCFGFIVNPADIPSAWDTTPAGLARWRVGAFHDFTMSYHTVRSFDRETGALRFNEPAEIPYGLGGGSAKRWWIENAAEMRPAPGSGQFMLLGDATDSTAASTLLYAPLAGEADPAKSEIELAVLGGGCKPEYSKEPWQGGCTALIWAHGQNPQHQLENVALIGLQFRSAATWYAGDGGQPWLPWLYSSAVHVGTSRGVRIENCSFGATANSLMVIDSSDATVERSLFEESGGVAFTFRNCENCLANNRCVPSMTPAVYRPTRIPLIYLT